MKRYLPCILAALVCVQVWGQGTRREPSLSDTVRSPEVSADRHVTFDPVVAALNLCVKTDSPYRLATADDE